MLHELEAVDVEQIALGQVHDVERSAAADGVVDDLVDLRRRGDALGEDARGFCAIVAKHVIGREAGHVGGDDGHFAQRLHGVEHALAQRLVFRQHDLHGQRSPSREERVIDEAALGVLRLGRDLAAGDAGGGKTDQAIGADDLLELPDDHSLDGQALRGGLEDIVAVGQIGELEGGDQTPLDGRSLSFANLSAVKALPDVLHDAGGTGI